MVQCRAKTQTKARCSRAATSDGLCTQHAKMKVRDGYTPDGGVPKPKRPAVKPIPAAKRRPVPAPVPKPSPKSDMGRLLNISPIRVAFRDVTEEFAYNPSDQVIGYLHRLVDMLDIIHPRTGGFDMLNRYVPGISSSSTEYYGMYPDRRMESFLIGVLEKIGDNALREVVIRRENRYRQLKQVISPNSDSDDVDKGVLFQLDLADRIWNDDWLASVFCKIRHVMLSLYYKIPLNEIARKDSGTWRAIERTGYWYDGNYLRVTNRWMETAGGTGLFHEYKRFFESKARELAHRGRKDRIVQWSMMGEGQAVFDWWYNRTLSDTGPGLIFWHNLVHLFHREPHRDPKTRLFRLYANENKSLIKGLVDDLLKIFKLPKGIVTEAVGRYTMGLFNKGPLYLLYEIFIRHSSRIHNGTIREFRSIFQEMGVKV